MRISECCRPWGTFLAMGLALSPPAAAGLKPEMAVGIAGFHCRWLKGLGLWWLAFC